VSKGGALGVMCSYNAINGTPACAHPLLFRALRGTWGFEVRACVGVAHTHHTDPPHPPPRVCQPRALRASSELSPCAVPYRAVRTPTHWQGYVTSDSDAILDMYQGHAWARTPEEAVASALRAGASVCVYACMYMCVL
jgi:hypothetical protein